MIDSTILALLTGSKIKSATYFNPSVSLINWCIASTRSSGVLGEIPSLKLVGSKTAGIFFSDKGLLPSMRNRLYKRETLSKNQRHFAGVAW